MQQDHLSLHPEATVNELYEHAEAYFSQGNLEAAIAYYQKTLARDPNYSWAYHKLGDVFSQKKQSDKAIDAYQKAIQFNPNFSWSYNNLGNAFVQIEQWDEAITAYQKAIELNPDFCWSYYNLGCALSQRQRWKDAIFAYFQAFRLDPQLPGLYERFGDAFQHSRELDLEFLALAENYENYLHFARELTHHHELSSAVYFYQLALKNLPISSELIAEFETVSAKQKHLDQQIYEAEKVVEEQPENHQAYYNLGVALARQKLWDKATTAFLKTLKLNPKLPLWLYQNVLDVLARTGQLENIIEFYRNLILENPNTLQYYVNLSHVFTQLNKYDQAIEYNKIVGLKILEKLHPDWLENSAQLKSAKSPDFLIIGTQKGGTTSLHLYLDKHPQILSSFIKEVPFWSGHTHRGLAWYLAHFPPRPLGANVLTGEATPINFNHPQAAENLFKAFPNVKLILMLRSPIDRAFSHYQHWLSLNWENRSFEDVVQQEIEDLNKPEKRDKVLLEGYVGRSLYIYFLRTWMNFFPKEQFLLLKSEDFYENPEQVLSRVIQFLGLPKYQLAEYRKYNSRSYLPLENSTRLMLKSYFKPYNQELEEFLGFKFNWDD